MHGELAAVAAHNEGPFTRRQALSSGYTPKMIAWRLRSGRWRAIRNGIYVDSELLGAADPACGHALDVAAVLLALRANDAAGSHHSAARVHGLALLRKPPPVITVTCPPVRTSRAARADVRLRCATLPDQHVTSRYSVRVTTPARTAIDLARQGSYEEGVVVADAVLKDRQATRTELDRVLADCRNWPGARQATRVVRFADSGAESVLESLARLLFEKYGLPPPQTQVLVGDEWGPIARVDFFWAEYGTVCEADGMLKYATPRALRDEKLRQERLVEGGYEVVRITWDDVVNRPEETVRRVRAALARGAANRMRVA